MRKIRPRPLPQDDVPDKTLHVHHRHGPLPCAAYGGNTAKWACAVTQKPPPARTIPFQHCDRWPGKWARLPPHHMPGENRCRACGSWPRPLFPRLRRRTDFPSLLSAAGKVLQTGGKALTNAPKRFPAGPAPAKSCCGAPSPRRCGHQWPPFPCAQPPDPRPLPARRWKCSGKYSD